MPERNERHARARLPDEPPSRRCGGSDEPGSGYSAQAPDDVEAERFTGHRNNKAGGSYVFPARSKYSVRTGESKMIRNDSRKSIISNNKTLGKHVSGGLKY